VFDTVLLRGTRPELLRLRDIAAHQDAALRAAGRTSPGMEALYRARLVAHKAAYDRIRYLETGEVRHAEILEAVAAATGLDAGEVPLLTTAEVAAERVALWPNRALLTQVAHRPPTTRLILVSDTYLSAADLRRLLDHHAPSLTGVTLHVSTDVGYSKRRGDLYPFVAACEGVAPGSILHAGDHPVHDVATARAAGWRALHLPRPPLWRLVNRLRDREVRRRLARTVRVSG
jgi:FMN phosphatase YigB (HAD superfamily)